MNIKITVGRLLNQNKNPVAENTVKEVQKEILRVKNSTGPIMQTDLNVVLRNINSRVRFNSLTPKEILFRRNTLTNDPLDIQESEIKLKKLHQRHSSSESTNKHRLKFKSKSPEQHFQLGDLVMLREYVLKNSPRETYSIDEIPQDEDQFILIRKLKQSIRPRLYKVLPDELIHIPSSKS